MSELTADEAMIKNLADKTGKPLGEWTAMIRKSGLSKHSEIVKLLKSKHGVTHGYANLIAHKVMKSDAGSATDDTALIEAQYEGPKAAMRPIYEAIVKAASGFGPDVVVAPKKAYVSLRRGKQFAIIQPSTKTRVDVGINLKGVPPAKRLEASGSFNSMVTHRVRLSDPSEVDNEMVGWLKQAYDAS